MLSMLTAWLAPWSWTPFETSAAVYVALHAHCQRHVLSCVADFRGSVDVSDDSKRAMETAIAANRAALKKAAKAAATAGHEEL